MNARAATLLVIGEGRRNDALAEELILDGFLLRRAEDTGVVKTRFAEDDTDLIIFGPTRDPGCEPRRPALAASGRARPARQSRQSCPLGDDERGRSGDASRFQRRRR